MNAALYHSLVLGKLAAMCQFWAIRIDIGYRPISRASLQVSSKFEA